VVGAGEAGGDYAADFIGTSAPTAHVSGLAALLLSLRPSPSSNDVRNIIEVTADKVGSVPYESDPFRGAHPHGSWNAQMGYGRINVHRALSRAHAMG
jgi:subtilisin family serine protease